MRLSRLFGPRGNGTLLYYWLVDSSDIFPALRLVLLFDGQEKEANALVTGWFRLPPPCFSRLRRHLGPCRLGHRRKPTLSANLTAFTSKGGHACGDSSGGCDRLGNLDGNDRLWNLARGNGYSPSSELVGVTRAFAFADCHRIPIMPQAGC